MYRLLILLFFLLASSACNSTGAQRSATITATMIPSPSFTTASTFTSVPSQTPTPSPSSTPTPSPTPLLWAGNGTALPSDLARLDVANASQVSGLAEWNIDSLSDMTWTPDGSLLVVASQSGIFFFDALRRELLRELYPQATHLVEIDFSPTSAWLISASREGTEESGFISRLELWQGPGWKPRGLIYDIPLAISDISFSPDGKALAAAFSSPIAERNELDFWDVSSWLITETLQTGPLLNIEISPDAELLASSPDLYALRVMDLGEKSWIYNLKTSFTGAVNSFAFSPDGLFLASGHYDGVIRIWDMRTGLLKLEFQSQEVIQSLVFSSDGRLLASGGSYESNLVRLWDPSTGLLLRTLEGHTSGVTHLLFSPENQFLVSGSYDGILRIWGIRP